MENLVFFQPPPQKKTTKKSDTFALQRVNPPRVGEAGLAGGGVQHQDLKKVQLITYTHFPKMLHIFHFTSAWYWSASSSPPSRKTHTFQSPWLLRLHSLGFGAKK